MYLLPSLILAVLLFVQGCKSRPSERVEPAAAPPTKAALAEPKTGGTETMEYPPVPSWKPEIKVPLGDIEDRMRYYTDDGRDFVIFQHGTVALVENAASDAAAKEQAREIISQIYNYHPDMNPQTMDDGNVLVSYNHPAFNVVLDEVTKAHWAEIEAKHLECLARDEVLITGQGPNTFDELGIKGLFGRCYFFMDAQDPTVVKVVRAHKAATPN